MRGGQAQINETIDEADRLANEALGLGHEAGQEDAPAFFFAQHVVVHFQRGTLGDLVPLVEQVEATLPNLDLGAIFALVCAEGGQTEEALRHLAAFAASDFTMPMDPIWLMAMAAYAEAITQCGVAEYAEPVLEQLAPWAHMLATPGGLSVLGRVSHFAGGLAAMLGRYDEAED